MFILKLMRAIAGMGLALANLIPGISEKNNRKLKKAALIFGISWLLIILLSALEFVVIYN